MRSASWQALPERWQMVTSWLRHAAIECRDIADTEFQRIGTRDEVADAIAQSIDSLLDLIREQWYTHGARAKPKRKSP